MVGLTTTTTQRDVTLQVFTFVFGDGLPSVFDHVEYRHQAQYLQLIYYHVYLYHHVHCLSPH